MHISKCNTYGFTLVELLIYITLVSILFTTVWGGIIYEMKSMGESVEFAKSYSTEEFIRHKLSVALLGAASVHTTSNSISFERPASESGGSLLFVLQDNTLVTSRGTGPATPLTLVGDVYAMGGTEPFVFDSVTGQVRAQFIVHGKEIKVVVYK